MLQIKCARLPVSKHAPVAFCLTIRYGGKRSERGGTLIYTYIEVYMYQYIYIFICIYAYIFPAIYWWIHHITLKAYIVGSQEAAVPCWYLVVNAPPPRLSSERYIAPPCIASGGPEHREKPG